LKKKLLNDTSVQNLTCNKLFKRIEGQRKVTIERPNCSLNLGKNYQKGLPRMYRNKDRGYFAQLIEAMMMTYGRNSYIS
jgi:hypothetical protein